jgi:hypothetical protein
MRRNAALIVLALVSVSCGAAGSSDTEATAPANASTTNGAPLTEGGYGTVQEMMKDVESTFYLCTAPIKIHDPPLDDDALAQADCSNTVSFFIYEPTDVAANVEELQANAEGTSALLVGDNWIISCKSDEAVCQRIQGGTGGELVVTP